MELAAGPLATQVRRPIATAARDAICAATDSCRPAGPVSTAYLGTMAQQLGLAVSERLLPHGVWGCSAGSRVLISSRLTPEWRRFVLAHELGHALIRTGRAISPDTMVEWWCDWFAIELLVPRAVDLDGDVDSLGSHLEVSPLVVWAQRLRGTGSTPAVRRAGGGLACSSCGIRVHVQGCPCVVRRRRAKVAWGLHEWGTAA
jgi:hypothetical protein